LHFILFDRILFDRIQSPPGNATPVATMTFYVLKENKAEKIPL
jgi:hypothetical protein